MEHQSQPRRIETAPARAAAEQGQLLLRPEQAARRLGISRTTLYQLIRDGAMPSMTIGRCRRIPAAALERWIEERTS